MSHDLNETAVFWAVFVIMCVCIVSLVQSTYAAVVLLLVLTSATCMYWYYRGREHFGPGDTVVMCTDGGNACATPTEQPAESTDISKLPLKKCDLYLTNNIDECDSGLYEMHYIEMEERRRALEKNPVVNAGEIEKLNRVLSDAGRLTRRQCKLTMGNWVRPHHSSFPQLKSMRSDYEARGNPRHWAYCYAPMEKDDSLEKLKDGIRNNGTSVARSGMKTMLSNGIENERIEFSTLKADDMRRAFCNFFNPTSDDKLASYYQTFSTPQQRTFIAVDMSPKGFIKGVQIYSWDRGYLVLSPPTDVETTATRQDDLTTLQSLSPDMPETPDRFNIEIAHYCSEKPLIKTMSYYRIILRQLYEEVVQDKKLLYVLKDAASVYAFNINMCDRVDRITLCKVTYTKC